MTSDEHRRPRLLAARELVGQERWGPAREVLAGADLEYVWTHDGMRNLNVRMQEATYAHFGREQGDRVADLVYERMTGWAFGATDAPAFREQVETFAMLWQWHRTPVTVVEDDERVSYVMAPCGSGGRLISAGAYLPSAPRPLTVLETASFASFSEANFPNWCAHCAFSNRGYLRRGMPYFLLEGWSDHRRWGGCAAHSYKHIALVPDEAFTRVGLRPPQREAAPDVPARVFSDAELAELGRPVVERIVEAVERHDGEAALRLIDRSWTAWMNLHAAYRCWFAMFADQLARERDAALAARLIAGAAWELVAPVLEDPAADISTWVRFWRNHSGTVEVVDRALRVPRDALIHPDQDPTAAEALAATLAHGVTEGASAAGYGESFGALRYAAGQFTHHLPIRWWSADVPPPGSVHASIPVRR